MTLPFICAPANDRVIKNERAGNIFGGNPTFNSGVRTAHSDLVIMNSSFMCSKSKDYSINC